MHQILTHLVAVLDSSKEPHKLVVKSVAVSRLSYAQERARDFRSQHTDINHLVVIAEIVQFQRRSEDIYTTDPRELGIAKSDDALEKLNPGVILGAEGPSGQTPRETGNHTEIIKTNDFQSGLKYSGSNHMAIGPVREESAACDDGWIEWKGGECPVGPDVLVEVGFRNGRVTKSATAGAWGWGRSRGVDDIPGYEIIKYRVVK
jgi:hypothetical protein